MAVSKLCPTLPVPMVMLLMSNTKVKQPTQMNLLEVTKPPLTQLLTSPPLPQFTTNLPPNPLTTLPQFTTNPPPLTTMPLSTTPPLLTNPPPRNTLSPLS